MLRSIIAVPGCLFLLTAFPVTHSQLHVTGSPFTIHKAQRMSVTKKIEKYIKNWDQVHEMVSLVGGDLKPATFRSHKNSFT